MRKLISMTLVVLLFPAAGYPLGLGEIRLHSALNQPLSAEIDLLSVSAEDASSLNAGLASSDLFAQMGLDRVSTLMLVKFEVVKRPNGTYIVKASSREPIRDPYLDFLLEVNWKSGRVLREYTVLLDPPEFGNQTPVAVEPPALEEPALPATTALSEPAPDADEPLAETKKADPVSVAKAQPDVEKALQAAKAEPQIDNKPEQPKSERQAAQPPVLPTPTQAAVAPAPKPVVREPEVITYGRVRRKETLWAIAKKLRPNRSVTLQQTMIALVRQNPYAFYAHNANRLKAGHVLRLDPTQLAAISREEAMREFAQQNREWRAYKQRAAAKAASRAPTSARVTQNGAAVVAAKKDEPRLKLVPPGEDAQVDKDKAATPGTGAKDADTLRKELMLAIETTEAQKQENDALRTRMQALQGQLDSMQRLLSFKADDLAALQRQAAQLGDKPKESAAADTKQAAPTTATASTPEASGKPTPAQAAQPAPSANPATSAAEKAVKPKAHAPAPVPAPVQQPSFLDSVLKTLDDFVKSLPLDKALVNDLFKNPLFAGVAALLAVVVGLFVLLVIRRRRSGASFQESILMGNSPSMLKAKAAEAAPKEETSFFSDFAVSGMGDIHAEDSEVDPLTEADVYMAYQRFQQAEELLEDAMKVNDRPELHAKLLEVYHATRNAQAFESEAEKFKAMVGGKGPLWDKTVTMGHELLPQNPLFGAVGENAVSGAGRAESRLDNEVLDIGLDLDALTEEMESGGDAHGGSDFTVDLGIDLSDLDGETSTGAGSNVVEAAPQAATESQDQAPEFDLGDLSLDLDEGGGSAQADTLSEPETDPGLDFSALDLGESAETVPSDVTVDDPQAGDLELGDFDLSSLELDQQADPASQAVDLSSALELGDTEEIRLDAGAVNGDDDGDFANLDEAGTKLDLARAYMEMGDSDGARGILTEVEQEGSAAQKEQARELLQQIA